MFVRRSSSSIDDSPEQDATSSNIRVSAAPGADAPSASLQGASRLELLKRYVKAPKGAG